MTIAKGKTLIVSVPWPVRLFGDLQYFLGLPAITLALDLRTAVAATPRSDGRFSVSAAWIPEPLSFDLGEAAEAFPQMPALSRALRAAPPQKEKLGDGCDFHVISRAPWTDALPDSPALLAAWTVALLSLDAQLADLSGIETAEVACRAYRDEQPTARWIPETYACILGGMLLLEPGDPMLSAAKPAKVAPIDRALPGIVSCYAEQGGKGLDRYAQAVRWTLSALSGIVKLQEGFSLRDASDDEVIPRLRELPEADAGIVYAHLAMRNLCRQAFDLLESEYGIDDDRLAELMDQQHELLRDYLGYNIPEIEALIPVATGGGALSSKIVLGTNSFIAVAPGREQEVISSVKQAGGDAVSVAVATGMRMETVPHGGSGKLKWSFEADKSCEAMGAASGQEGRFLRTMPDEVSNECKMKISDAGQSVESQTGFATIPPPGAASYQWVNVTMNGPFAPRDGCGALVFQKKMWLLGGWNPQDKAHFPRICNNEVWSSADGVAWTLVKPNTFKDQTFKDDSDWEGRHTAGYVVFKDRMWIVGGDPIQKHYQNDVWNSTDGKNWTCVMRNAPWGPRALHYTVAFKDKIWVMGGQTLPQFAPEAERFYRDIWCSSDGTRWERVEPKEPYWPERGMIGGSVVFQGRMWILGGGTYDTAGQPERKYFTDVWSSGDGVNWLRHTDKASWFPRQYHDAAVFDGKMWVLEGWNRAGGNRNDVWYSQDGVNWHELPNTPWASRHAASVFVHDNALWIALGNNMQPDVWKLVRTPAGNQ